MLTLNAVNTFYGKSHVLFNVSLEVRRGEIVALLGRNGVGKSTTLGTIMGLVPAQNGSIRFMEKEILGRKPHQNAMAGLGFVPEQRWIFPNLTVHQNLLMGIKPGFLRKAPAGGWTIERAYDSFPQLAERRHQLGGILSGGEKQMLTIVRTLLGNPELILIDEPTEGLAPLIVEHVNALIADINGQGLTVLLVEQNLQTCLRLAHRIYILSKGAVKWTGTPKDLEECKDVRKQYLEV
ncbi:MAG TPA: ABC transporter ATP-binding protein [Syntrophobacteraceae bacterium]|jgi:branched-chain amino acid transport system ATP-binding protein|nr:ABC transporter ATP-binding protein [Syntrophobacteraceae bacterium]